MTDDLTDDDLIRFGWAPGGYTITCNACNQKYWDGSDKRAFRCRPCAVIAFNEWKLKMENEPQPTPQANPITVKELLERGMDDRLAEIIHSSIGDQFRNAGNITVDELNALGYGQTCPCGERGMDRGEVGCSNCGQCKECCENGDQPCSCTGCACKS